MCCQHCKYEIQITPLSHSHISPLNPMWNFTQERGSVLGELWQPGACGWRNSLTGDEIILLLSAEVRSVAFWPLKWTPADRESGCVKRASHVSVVCLFLSLGFVRYCNCIFSCLNLCNRNFLGETQQSLLGFFFFQRSQQILTLRIIPFLSFRCLAVRGIWKFLLMA